MTQSINDIVVEFDIGIINMDIFDFLLDLAPDTWWNETTHEGRIVGFSFRNAEDATAFRLRFAL